MKIRQEDIDDLTRGAAFLGSGGGGDPYIGRLIAKKAIDEFGAPRIVTPQGLRDDDVVVSIAGYGAPTVQLEKLIGEGELVYALGAMEEHLGITVTAILPAEIGGGNSILPITLAAKKGLAVVDADGMGRAFPELQMNNLSIDGLRATPMVVVDEHLNSAIVTTEDNHVAERVTRAVAVQLGLRVIICCFPITGADVKRSAIANTLSTAIEIGKAIRLGRETGMPVDGLIQCLRASAEYHTAAVLFEGKIYDLTKDTSRGFFEGVCRLTGLDDPNDSAEVVFQNENLIVRVNGEVKTIVPDLICMVDQETAEPITTQSMRYGQRVKVIGVSAPEALRRELALEVVGPSAFGLEEEFTPIEDLILSGPAEVEPRVVG